MIIAGADKIAVDTILTKNGTASADDVTYNLSAVAGWQIGTITIMTAGITVSNATGAIINSATYDASTGNLVLTGLNFNTSSTIDVTKLTITGQGGSTVTLTSSTSDPTPLSATSTTTVIAGADKTAVDTILNSNGSSSLDATTYNVTVSSGWQTGAMAISTIGITVSNHFILDLLPGANVAAAYSLRQLRMAYTGPLIQISRGGGQVQDIYADSSGNLNASAASAFLGATNGYVTIWYDQSGNSNNATQSILAEQLGWEDGAPFFIGNGSQFLAFTNTISLTNFTISTVYKVASWNTLNYILGGNGTGVFVGGLSNYGLGELSSSNIRSAPSTIEYYNQIKLIAVTNTKVYDGLSEVSSYNHTNNLTGMPLTVIGLRADLTNLCHCGNIYEIVIYNSTLSDTNRVILGSDQINYYQEQISSATYDASTGNLVLKGMHFNTSSAMDVTKLTITGQGGSTVRLTSATSNPMPASSTSATMVIAGADKAAVDLILNKSGTSSVDSTAYNVSAASGLQTGAAAITTAGITVSNPAGQITSAAYNALTGDLVLTGLYFNTSATIDVTKLIIRGQGWLTANLTSATANPIPSSSTSATVVIAGADKTAVDAILTKAGTASADGIIYNLFTTSGWLTGAAAINTAGITVSNSNGVIINSATYDISTGNLALTGLNFNTSAMIDVTKMTITGQGGSGSQRVLTSATGNPTPVSDTSATVVISGADKIAVDAILTKDGTAALDSTTYNVAAASGWQTGAPTVSTVGITVSNAAEVISNTTYDASTGNLVLTGMNFNTSSTIDVTKLTITGQGGSTATLTSATINPTPASATSATVTIAGVDKIAVDLVLNKNGTSSVDSTTYNVTAASSWQTGTVAVSTIGLTVSNAAELISMATYSASTGTLVLTGLNFNTSSIIDVTKLTIKGQGGAGSQRILTSATLNPTPSNATSATVTIAGADKTAMNAILTQNGTTAPDLTIYNVATASGWQTGAAAVSTVGITVSNAAEVISTATYDASSGNLVLTGLNFNTSATIDVTKLTIKGQGGTGAQFKLTAATSNPNPASTTSATVAITGTDKTAVTAILNKNGTTAPDSTTYNVAAASGWQSGAATVSTVKITVSNAAEVISSATYKASTGNLVLTGLNFNTSATIDVTKLTITGQGGAGAQVTLTAATINPTPASSTSATVAISGADKTAVTAILTQNGTIAPDSTTYNVAASSNWQTGAAAVSAVGITVSNAAEVISSATYDASSGNLVLTGLNFNTSSTINVTKLTIKGQGGTGSQRVLTVATSNPTPASSTSATVAIAGADKAAVTAILNKNGTTAIDSTTYNVAAASSWQTGTASVSTVGITVSNAS